MSVDMRPDETLESLLRRFKRGVSVEGITRVFRSKMSFLSKGEKRRLKRKRAERRRKRHAYER